MTAGLLHLLSVRHFQRGTSGTPNTHSNTCTSLSKAHAACHDMQLASASPHTRCCSLHDALQLGILWCRYSGALFMIAAIILACAEHVAMIVVGRVFQGVAVSSSSWSGIDNAICTLVMLRHSVVGV